MLSGCSRNVLLLLRSVNKSWTQTGIPLTRQMRVNIGMRRGSRNQATSRFAFYMGRCLRHLFLKWPVLKDCCQFSARCWTCRAGCQPVVPSNNWGRNSLDDQIFSDLPCLMGWAQASELRLCQASDRLKVKENQTWTKRIVDTSALSHECTILIFIDIFCWEAFLLRWVFTYIL